MKAKAVLLNLAVAVIALVVLFPLVWMLSVSFMAAGGEGSGGAGPGQK